MTFVAAKRFGQRIQLASDTMVSDPNELRRDVIPGRLKTIILDAQITIAYAGLSYQSMQAIKRAKQVLSDGGTLSDIEQILLSTTEKYKNFENGPEFLLVSHRDGPVLKRVWDNQVSRNLDQACIGQRDLLSSLLEREKAEKLSLIPHEFEDEGPFSSAFLKLFNGIYISESVGGFGITTTCSPYGHCYPSFAGVTSWEMITIGQGVTEQHLADRQSGKTQWGYNISGSKLRGVGVVGAVVLDAGIGYIYAPIHSGDPIPWKFERPANLDQHPAILGAFQEEIDRVADLIGGGIEVTFPPSRSQPPNEVELERVVAHAAKATLPTRVTLEDQFVRIDCAGQMIRVGFGSLEPNPVWVLSTTIDRMNAAALANHHQSEGGRP